MDIREYTQVGACGNFAWGPVILGSDTLYVQIGSSGVFVGAVRSETWVGEGLSSGHGRVNNGIDVDVTE
jgi:hypothetical protein